MAGLRRALLDDFEPELILACKYGVLLAHGYRRSEIARRLPEETPAGLRAAEQRVKKATLRLDSGD